MTEKTNHRREPAISEVPAHPFDKRWFVHLNSKIQGPFSGHEIERMVERHELSFADLAYSEGGTDWIQLGQDPILGTLFGKVHRNTDELNEKGGNKQKWSRAVGIVATLLIFGAIGWMVWPYYSAYNLFIAIRDGDVLALERGVAWESVRQGLRDDLNVALLQKIGTDAQKNNSKSDTGLASGFAAIIGPAIIDRMVNSYITPQAIVTLRRNGQAQANSINASTMPAATNLSEAVQSAQHIQWKTIRYAFFSGGMFSFKVDFIPQHDPSIKNPISLLFVWEGSWKLTRIVLPADAMGGLSTVAKSTETQKSPIVNIPPPMPSNVLSPTAAVRKELAPLDVKLTSKSFKAMNVRANDFQDEILIGLSIQNVMDKDIRAFDGTLRFTDLLDNEVFTSKLAINEAVRSGSTMAWNGSIKYNQFDDGLQRLRSAQKENLKIQFVSRKVLFVDGSVKEFTGK